MSDDDDWTQDQAQSGHVDVIELSDDDDDDDDNNETDVAPSSQRNQESPNDEVKCTIAPLGRRLKQTARKSTGGRAPRRVSRDWNDRLNGGDFVELTIVLSLTWYFLCRSI